MRIILIIELVRAIMVINLPKTFRIIPLRTTQVTARKPLCDDDAADYLTPKRVTRILLDLQTEYISDQANYEDAKYPIGFMLTYYMKKE